MSWSDRFFSLACIAVGFMPTVFALVSLSRM